MLLSYFYLHQESAANHEKGLFRTNVHARICPLKLGKKRTGKTNMSILLLNLRF